jgi:hypothetical protein
MFPIKSHLNTSISQLISDPQQEAQAIMQRISMNKEMINQMPNLQRPALIGSQYNLMYDKNNQV